jgi:cytochrome b561
MDDPSKPAIDEPTYSPAARRFHWWTVALLLIQIPVGLYMAYRGGKLDIWDDLTNNLYSGHKLLGIVILLLVLARLYYRLTRGAPPDEPTITWWQKGAAHMTHWALYGLLLLVPMLGWIGVSLYPALDIFGLFKLPALTVANEEMASKVLFYHWLFAILLLLAVSAHISGALFHYLIRKDGVLRRMLPSAGRRS